MCRLSWQNLPLIRITRRIADALHKCCIHVPKLVLLLLQRMSLQVVSHDWVLRVLAPLWKGKDVFLWRLNKFTLHEMFRKFLFFIWFVVCVCACPRTFLETLELKLNTKGIKCYLEFLKQIWYLLWVVYIVREVDSILLPHAFWSLRDRSSMSEPLVSPPGFGVWPRRFYFRSTVNWVASSGEWIFLWWVMPRCVLIQLSREPCEAIFLIFLNSPTLCVS